MYFNENILLKIQKDRQIISYFRTALARKEFLVYYQPKVCMDNKRISGCEALVRWNHDGSVISPADFVPVLENEGLICDLDFYVLERVCENIRDWIDHDIIPAKVSVNFSKLHLKVKTEFSFEEHDEEVVWRVRQENISAAMETEVRCLKKDMLLINYESPDGTRRHNRLWNGGNGRGIIKLYEKNDGRLILEDEIEATHIGCEYGEYDHEGPY